MSFIFQSTFPRGERHCRNQATPESLRLNFNPRSRVGNDTCLLCSRHGTRQFQSTFPRGERPACIFVKTTSSLISIHVPAWGTTLSLHHFHHILQFQSTFPRGERPCSQSFSRSFLLFQSTFPRGERPR